MTAASSLSPLQRLRAVLDDAVLNVTGGERPAAAPTLERPKQEAHGDYATNAAMLLPKLVGAAPAMIAERLAVALTEHLGDDLTAVAVAGPGFLNLRLSDGWLRGALADVVAAGERFGAAPDDGTAEAVHLEFVSNNPTGPVHIGGARGAAFGSALANLLAFRGHRVHREYYVNDHGNQVELFGRSLQARARGEAPPEEGYQGGYVAAVAAQIPDAATRPVAEVATEGIALMVAAQRASLAAFRTTFDEWFSERTLHAAGDGAPSPVDRALGVLADQGRTYEQDGALFLRTTDTGDDKDRVLLRSDGRATYFASDVAYHHDKRVRGYDRVIDVLGADHHGYVARIQAAFVALGGDRDRIELLITQFVNLYENGERVRMSKRTGEFVALDDLVEEIGVDAARWYLLARSHDTTIDLDLAEARAQSAENPVYYVQYAHARIRSILQRAANGDVTGASDETADAGTDDRSGFVAAERELLLMLVAWPDEVAEAADRRAPHRVATYALALARRFSAFYRDCPVLAAGLDDDVRARRLELCRATATILAAGLGILGVDAPERMDRAGDEDEAVAGD